MRTFSQLPAGTRKKIWQAGRRRLVLAELERLAKEEEIQYPCYKPIDLEYECKKVREKRSDYSPDDLPDYDWRETISPGKSVFQIPRSGWRHLGGGAYRRGGTLKDQ